MPKRKPFVHQKKVQEQLKSTIPVESKQELIYGIEPKVHFITGMSVVKEEEEEEDSKKKSKKEKL